MHGLKTEVIRNSYLVHIRRLICWKIVTNNVSDIGMQSAIKSIIYYLVNST
jgi:hypothetical protein